MSENHPQDPSPLPEDVESYGKHYNEADFWEKAKTLPRSAMNQVLEKALLCRELLLDTDTPLWVKGTLIGVLGYLILPFDLVPDVLPGAGFIDDVAVMGLVLANLDHLVTDDVRRRVEERMAESKKAEEAGEKGD